MSQKNKKSQNIDPYLYHSISFPHCFLIHYLIFRNRELVF